MSPSRSVGLGLLCFLAEVRLGLGCCGLIPGAASCRRLLSALPPLSSAGHHQRASLPPGKGLVLGGGCLSTRLVAPRVERLSKSTKLHVHRLYYKYLIIEFNNMVKDARASYFAKLISSSKRNPKDLFDTINIIVTPVFSNKDCSNFLSFLMGNIRDVRASIIPSSTPFSADPTRPSILDCFSPISMQDLIDLVDSIKPSSSPLDILPMSMFKKLTWINSTEKALLRVRNDIMMSSHVGECSVLVLLDLRSAFDAVDHSIPTKREICSLG
ncbi:hypothetical protein N1851_025768 [Merluccius polli]|uniref:Reverse transcriptase domain-containing protein n=1 Tax=Merluccius polli TaxID=89951 RepID=A0AA47MD88_MERPO|nr:hypothetical protein N1851_025768 [Merluccius polli]